MELLIQWKLYSYNKSDAEKMEELQAALRQVLSEAQAAELKGFMDSLMTQQQQKSQQQMKGIYSMQNNFIYSKGYVQKSDFCVLLLW